MFLKLSSQSRATWLLQEIIKETDVNLTRLDGLNSGVYLISMMEYRTARKSFFFKKLQFIKAFKMN
jgi:hypothetical protein